MINLYKLLFRPIIFRLDSEKAHHAAIRFCRLIWKFKIFRNLTSALYADRIEHKSVNLRGLILKNAVGLAAGADKNAELIEGLEQFGFGFAEIGTITPLPQQGNPKPRMHRETSRGAIVNRMGFPNEGADEIFERVKLIKSKIGIPIGVNIGKNKHTPNTAAVSDYQALLKKFQDLADYYTVNLSSPNTPGLRELQSLEFLDKLNKVIRELGIAQPVFLKLSPELSTEQLKDVCSCFGRDSRFTGLVLTNTIATDLGGISGKPLAGASRRMLINARQILRDIAARAPNSQVVPIISVGGIDSKAEYEERLRLGAQAVQIYTGLVYEGPSLIKNILS